MPFFPQWHGRSRVPMQGNVQGQTTADRQNDNVPARPLVWLRRKSTGRQFQILQQFEGVVCKCDAQGMRVELSDLTSSNPREFADISLEDVSEQDLPLVKPGAVFYWSLGFETSTGGQRSRVSEIRFRLASLVAHRKILTNRRGKSLRRSMMAPQDNPPKSDEVEVSIFGPGVGESLVLHIGSGEWVVVDSCMNGDRSSPAALEYLREIGVDPATQIKWVIATHWHDDHVEGISEILTNPRRTRGLAVRLLFDRWSSRRSLQRAGDQCRSIVPQASRNSQKCSRYYVGRPAAVDSW